METKAGREAEKKMTVEAEIADKGGINDIREKYSRIYASVDLDAISFNVGQMKRNLAEGTKIIGVVKTDGYGHGAVPVARELETREEVSGFAVATAEEAMALKESGIRKPVLVLGYAFPECYEELVDREIRLTVFRPDTVGQLAECAGRLKKKAFVHIKVDTGMSRIGIRPDGEGLELIKKVLGEPELVLEGIFTHFARADEEDKSFTEGQLFRFQQFLERVEKETGYRAPVCHCSNSAAILEMRKADMDAVRAGIALYGLWPSPEVARDTAALKPAMEVKSRIAYVKEIQEGTPVSYGGDFVAGHKMRVATVPVGYGDGYPRGLSGKGYVLVKGKRAPILGKVCMDQFMVEVTDIPEAKEGDWATLVGRDGEAQITMEELGEMSGRFHYEFACCIGKRVPRIYLKAGKVVGTKDYFRDFG